MLYTIAVILIILWLLGVVTSYTLGGFILCALWCWPSSWYSFASSAERTLFKETLFKENELSCRYD